MVALLSLFVSPLLEHHHHHQHEHELEEHENEQKEVTCKGCFPTVEIVSDNAKSHYQTKTKNQNMAKNVFKDHKKLNKRKKTALWLGPCAGRWDSPASSSASDSCCFPPSLPQSRSWTAMSTSAMSTSAPASTPPQLQHWQLHSSNNSHSVTRWDEGSGGSSNSSSDSSLSLPRLALELEGDIRRNENHGRSWKDSSENSKDKDCQNNTSFYIEDLDLDSRPDQTSKDNIQDASKTSQDHQDHNALSLSLPSLPLPLEKPQEKLQDDDFDDEETLVDDAMTSSLHSYKSEEETLSLDSHDLMMVQGDFSSSTIGDDFSANDILNEDLDHNERGLFQEEDILDMELQGLAAKQRQRRHLRPAAEIEHQHENETTASARLSTTTTFELSLFLGDDGDGGDDEDSSSESSVLLSGHSHSSQSVLSLYAEDDQEEYNSDDDDDSSSFFGY